MQDYTIVVEMRSELGSSQARRCRKEGYLPGVAYHRGEESSRIKVSYKDFVRIAEKSRKAQVFRFKSDSSILDGKSVIVKGIQRDYQANRLTHVDFQTLKDDEVISIDIPVSIVGEAPGVKVDGGVLTVITHEISIRCLPKDIPNMFAVDVTKLRLNESIHAKDLVLPSGVELVDDPEETIVSIAVPRAAVEETKAAEAEAAATAAAGTVVTAPAAGKKPESKK